ncbi:MAG: FdtA/QdtA family cupin domain-containing protein [Chitinophagales bacterium]
MSYIVNIKTHSRENVDLTVYENILEEPIQRIFFLTNLKEGSIRGGNIAVNAYEGIICVKGYCEVHVCKDKEDILYILDSPNKCLIIEPYEWHQISQFEDDSILLAFSNKKYNEF